MSDRLVRALKCQGVKHEQYNFTMLPNGAGAVTQGEGDTAASFVTITRTGVGTGQIVTAKGFQALVTIVAQVMLAAPVAASIVFGTPVQATNGVLTIPFSYFVGVAGAEFPAAAASNRFMFSMTLRNSTVKP
jgi:hypothetical protein